MKASPWEKEDAMREGVAILNFLAPKAFTHENGTPDRRGFRKSGGRDATRRAAACSLPTGEPDVIIPCDDVLVAVGQENAFPWIERDVRRRLWPRRPADRSTR